MAKNSQRPSSRPYFYLGIFFVAWILVPTGWKLVVQSTFEEFHAPIWEASSRLRDLTHYWGHISDSKNTLIKKGRDHARILADTKIQIERKEELRKEITELRNLKLEINRLEKSLGLSSAFKYSSELSRVTRRTLSGWSQSVEIDKGINFKIREGYGVIFADGIIGRIKKVNSRSSQIQLITNQGFRIVAHLKGDNRPITFRGSGISIGGISYGFISDVPQDVIVPKDNQLEIVSSALGGRFPKGIKIGTVNKLEPSTDGLFQTGKVRLSNKLNEIEEVTILRKDYE